MASSSDEEQLLFGESLKEEKVVPLEKDFNVTIPNRFDDRSDSIPKIMKLPSSALSVDFRAPYTPTEGMEEPKSANVIRYRHGEHGLTESNARLIEWEDGSWTLVVGNEHFRVFERKEDVAIFDKQNDQFYISVCQVEHQLNVIPGSLDSRTHKKVVEQSAVSRKLVESRKVNLASGTSAGAVITSQGSLPAVAPRQPAQRRQKLTAAFLEDGLTESAGTSVRDIKSRFRQGPSAPKRAKMESVTSSSSSVKDEEDEEEDDDVSFINDEDSGDDSDSSSGSSSSSSTSSSSSSSGSSDSS